MNERAAILAARDELRVPDHSGRPRSEDGTQAGAEASTVQDARNLGYFHVNVLQGSPDPRSRVESAIAELSCKLRAKPTIPASPSCPQQPQQEALREDTAVLLPALHCAFQQCTWSGISEACLLTHLKAKHAKQLEAGKKLIDLQDSGDDAWWAIYNAAVSRKCQESAPCAAYSIDRRCLRQYTNALTRDGVQGLICFCCARRFPHLVAMNDKQVIDWISVAESSRGSDAQGSLTMMTFMGI